MISASAKARHFSGSPRLARFARMLWQPGMLVCCAQYASRPLDAQIDRLYQLPLDEFTAARNALAKESGAAAAEIRALQKPPIAAWAINQVYWRGRAAFHGLTAAAAALRDAHTAVVTGKPADLRAAGKAHEDALEAVVKLAVAILRDAGQPATDATRQAIATTLRALPASTDPPGRLTHAAAANRFRAARGPARGPRARIRTRAPQGRAGESVEGLGPSASRKDAAREKAVAKAKEAVAAALRAERSAEQHARREEFEAARTAREADRAASDLAKAQAALEAAQEAVEKAERDAETATRKKDAAARAHARDRRVARRRQNPQRGRAGHPHANLERNPRVRAFIDSPAGKAKGLTSPR